MKAIWAVASFLTLWLIPVFLGFKIYDTQFDDYTLFMSLFWLYREQDAFYRIFAIIAVVFPLLASFIFGFLSFKASKR